MAHTKVTKTYSQNTGAANTFSYSGSFDVFKGTEVVALLNNVQLTFTASTINESASPREYTVDTSAKTIHIGGADLSSGTIIIRPETDMGAPTPRATYAPGSSVTAEDLNNNQTQLMRKAMEYDETKMSSTGDTMTGDLTMGEDQTIIFEGGTDDGYETTLTVADPTADRTITLPNVTGTVVTTGDTGSVATAMIADDAVDNDKLANSIVSAIAANTAKTTNQTHTGDVTGSTTLTIANDAVGADQLDSNAVVNDSVASAAAIEFTKLENLDSTKILVGNSSNKAAEVSMSGDVAISNTGATTIQANAVEIGMIGCEQTTISDSDSHIPTSGAVVDYVSGAITPLGGFEAIATEDVFPTTEPIAGVIVSISDATEISVNSSGVATNCRTDGNGSDNVTINNFPTSLRGGVGGNADPYILPATSGLLVISTGSSHTYNYHRLIATTDDVKLLSDTVESFKARYRVASSAPGSDNNDGDLYYNTTNDTLYVYDGSQWEASVSSTPNENSVDSVHYVDGSIDLEHMSSESVDEDNLYISNAGSNGQFLQKQSGNDGGLTWATVVQGTPTAITVADESSDTTCFPLFVTTATGDQAPKTGSNLTFNSDTGALGATSFTGDGSGLTGLAAGATGGNSGANAIFWENEQTVTHDYTIGNNKNAGSFGPITINSGVTVTVGSGENWTIV